MFEPTQLPLRRFQQSKSTPKEKPKKWSVRERDRKRESRREREYVYMGLCSFGQDNRLAPHQKHSTWKEEIWTISPFSTEEVCTVETLAYVLSRKLPGFLPPPCCHGILCVGSSLQSIPSTSSCNSVRRPHTWVSAVPLFSALYVNLSLSLFHYRYLRLDFSLSVTAAAVFSFGSLVGGWGALTSLFFGIH